MMLSNLIRTLFESGYSVTFETEANMPNLRITILDRVTNKSIYCDLYTNDIIYTRNKSTDEILTSVVEDGLKRFPRYSEIIGRVWRNTDGNRFV